DPSKLAPDGPAPLARAFDNVTLDGKPIALTRDEYSLAPAPNSNLYLLDGIAGQLLRIDPSGVATVVRSLTGFAKELSTPVLDRRGQMLMFAAKSDTSGPSPASPLPLESSQSGP